MCRFVAYLGHETLLENVLIKPVNSLLAQSKHARESNSPTNGDGFGLGWYNPSLAHEPGLFVSVYPAWNDANLKHLAAKIKSPCFFAHIRAATAGGVTHYNCHPFVFDNLQFMHNGGVGNFIKVKRHLRHCLDDDIYHWIKGETDSEHLMALFLQHAKKEKAPLNSQNMTSLLNKTLSHALSLTDEFGEKAPSFLNLCVSNGRCIVASRVHTHKNITARSLHYSIGERFEFVDGKAHMQNRNSKTGAVLVSSEKLNDFDTEWVDIKENSIITVDEDLNIHTTPFVRE